MKRFLVVGIVVLGLAAPAPALGHTLSIKRARSWAQAQMNSGNESEPLTAVRHRVYSCKRHSRHQVRCRYRASYPDETGTCHGRVAVFFEPTLLEEDPASRVLTYDPSTCRF